MKRGKISPNAIVVLLFGVTISFYLGFVHHSVVGAIIFLIVTIIGTFLVNRSKTRRG